MVTARAGRAAIVTGGSRGIGLEIARMPGELEYGLTLTVRGPDSLEEATLALAASGCDVGCVAADVSNEDGIRRANRSLAMARAVIVHSGLSARDVLLTAAPLQGGVGFINGACSVALTGCTLVIAPDLTPGALLGLISDRRVTRIATLPTIASRLPRAPDFEPRRPQCRGDPDRARVPGSGRRSDTGACLWLHGHGSYGAIDVGAGDSLRGGARPPTAQIVAFVDANKDAIVDSRRLGVEPICEVLQVASSTYYAARDRPR